MFVFQLRQAHPRAQGDIGEAAAVEWLVRAGYRAWLPFGHSPDVDLIAEQGDVLLRVQVKTSTFQRNGRFEVHLVTNGGNQSWSRVSKFFSAARCDYLFVLTADERKWFIPAAAVGGRRQILLGGPKYAEFEVDNPSSRPQLFAL
jgi:Holliday junction resolvase-like predicted endonuclease